MSLTVQTHRPSLCLALISKSPPKWRVDSYSYDSSVSLAPIDSFVIPYFLNLGGIYEKSTR